MIDTSGRDSTSLNTIELLLSEIKDQLRQNRIAAVVKDDLTVKDSVRD